MAKRNMNNGMINNTKINCNKIYGKIYILLPFFNIFHCHYIQ